MKQKLLCFSRPVPAAIAWSVIYVACFVLGNLITSPTKPRCFGSAVLLWILLAVYLLFAPRLGLRMGFCRPQKHSILSALFYLPMAALILFVYGIYDTTLDGNSILCLIAAAVAAAILQESIHRGLLCPALREEAKLAPGCVLLISGATMCTDAVLFCVADDSLIQLLIRLGICFAAGVMLGMVSELTHSVIPGTIFHILFLTAQLITVETDDSSNFGQFLAVAAICLLYTLFMAHRMRKHS